MSLPTRLEIDFDRAIRDNDYYNENKNYVIEYIKEDFPYLYNNMLRKIDNMFCLALARKLAEKDEDMSPRAMAVEMGIDKRIIGKYMGITRGKLRMK
jgi:hypothetical protein